jgi:hypothetical protein
MSERYNGWTNYETWLVNLWMDNEPGSQEFFSEQAKEIYDEAAAKPHLTREEVARQRFADYLEDFHEEHRPEMPTCGLYYDLISGALSAVNWDEIARHYIDSILEEESNASS